MTQNKQKHEAAEQALADAMASFPINNNARIEAQKKFAVLDATQNGDNPKLDLKIGQARRAVKQLTIRLTDQQRQWRKLAQEEIAARYVLAEEEHRQVRLACEEFQTQQEILTTRLEVAQQQLARTEARLNEQGARGRRLMVGPLKTYVESKAKDALAVVRKAGKKVKELETEFAQVKSQREQATARLAFLTARLEETLALGESHLRVLSGSPEKIRAQLDDPHVTVDRLALEELLVKWNAGFTERMQDHLAPARNVTFYVRTVNVYYWADTGAIAATAILGCDDGRSTEWPRSLKHANFSESGTRRELEASRAQL